MHAKFGRSLTGMESGKIWSTGSFHGLDMFVVAIHNCSLLMLLKRISLRCKNVILRKGAI